MDVKFCIKNFDIVINDLENLLVDMYMYKAKDNKEFKKAPHLYVDD